MLVPRSYQVETIERALTQNLLIADDCGLGKTLSAIEVAKKLTVNDPFKRVLVVCPKSIIQQWVDQIQMQDPNSLIYILTSVEVNLSSTYGWLIIHYDALDKAAYITAPVYSVLIADEAHRLRNKNNKWTKAIKRIRAIRTLALTATPMDKRVGDYWSILHFLGAPVPAYHGFKAMFEDWSFGGPYPKYEGAKNVEGLQRLLARWMIKHTKEEAAPDLPSLTLVPTSVAMTEEQTKMFEQLEAADDIEAPVDGLLTPLIIQNALVRIVRLQQLGSDPMLLGSLADSGKLLWVREFLEDHPNEKVVVFTKFRDTAIRLATRFDASLIVGGVQERLNDFKKGGLNVLVGTIAGMGIGTDLPMATYSIFVDMEWSSLQMQQAYDRIHRMNITEAKFAYILLSNKIDRLVFRTVAHKRSQEDMILSYLKRSFETD